MRALFIVSFLFVLLSCDNREDYFEKINRNPVIKIYNGDFERLGEINDSIKMGFSRQYRVVLEDEENLSIKSMVPEGVVLSGVGNITLGASGSGNFAVVFYAVDTYGKWVERTINLKSFSNLLPVALFNVSDLGSREIEVNASSSYDRDSNYGGYIVSYEYDFNGNIQLSSLSTVRYRFGSSGSKRIGLRVKDNNNEWSAKREIYMNVN